MSVSDDLVLRMRATGTRRTARDVDEATFAVDRFGAAVDRADKKVNKLGALATGLTTLGPALVPALAAATGGVFALGNAFGPAALGALAFGKVFQTTVKGVAQAATQIEAAQYKVNSTYGPQFVTQHTAAVKQLTLLNRQLTDKFGAGGPQIVSRYADASQAVQTFQQSFNPQVFKLLGSGLTLIQRLLPKLRPLLLATAGAFQKIADSAVKGVGGSGFKKFLAWMTVEAPKGIAAFAKIVTNLAVGFYNLFRAFGGGEKMRQGLVGMSKAFADWAKHLGTNKGFQGFLRYVRDAGPKVLDTLGKLGGTLVSLAPALGAAGSSALILLNAIAGLIKWVTGWPVIGKFVGALIPFLAIASKLLPLIKAMGVAIGFLTLSSEASITAFWALNGALAANPVLLVVGALVLLGGALYLAYTRSKTFRETVQGIWGTIKIGAQESINFVIGLINSLLNRLNDISDAIKAVSFGAIDLGHFGNLGPATFADPAAPKSGFQRHQAAQVKAAKRPGTPILQQLVPESGQWLHPLTPIHIHLHTNGREIANAVVTASNAAKSVR